MVSSAKDCDGLGGLMDEAPESFDGVKRFAATMMSQAVNGARYVADYARKDPRGARVPRSRVVDSKLLNGCAAWLWMLGEGSDDITFEECSWAVGWDPDWVREKVMAPYGELGDINKWVRDRADSLGPLWGD